MILHPNRLVLSIQGSDVTVVLSGRPGVTLRRRYHEEGVGTVIVNVRC